MINDQKSKQYNLEERTLIFSKKVINFIKTLPKNPINNAMIEQLIRSATSIGANYREANESNSKKDFKFRIMICIIAGMKQLITEAERL